MKDRLSKGNRLIIPYKAVFIILLILVVLLLIPLFVLAGYSVPAADDFSFSCETHAAYLRGGGLFSLIAAAAAKTAEVYESWQGTFSAVFLMAFQPSVWGFRFYFLTAWLMILPLAAGVFLLSLRVFSGIFESPKSLSGIVALVIVIGKEIMKNRN